MITSIILFSKLPFIVTCKEKMSGYNVNIRSFYDMSMLLTTKDVTQQKTLCHSNSGFFFKLFISALNICYERDTSFPSTSNMLLLETEEFNPHYQESPFTFSRKFSMFNKEI